MRKMAGCLSLLTLLLGCAQTPDAVDVSPAAPVSYFTGHELPLNKRSVTQLPTLIELSDEQKQDFLRHFNNPKFAHVKPHMRLADYLQSKLYGYGYEGKTHTAKESLAADSGNCLSLALTTTALANLVGLKVEYQQVDSNPIYHKDGGVMTLSGHVRSHVYDPTFEPEEGIIYLRKPRVIIDYFSDRQDVYGGMIAEADFYAMYYQNKAAEALIKDDLELAYSYLSKGIEIAPDNPATLNSLAVVANRAGLRDAAESIYRYALETDRSLLLVIANYVDFLQAQGRGDEARQWETKINEFNDNNPYRWIAMANEAIARGQYSVAAGRLNKAMRLAPYLHNIDFALARLYHDKREFRKAKAFLQNAKAKARTSEDERLYAAKLHQMRHVKAFDGRGH